MNKLIFLIPLFLFCTCGKDDPDKNLNFYPIDIPSDDLRDISFIDDYNGMICGGNSFFAKTTDGGKTWQVLDVGLPYGLSTAFMLDLQTLFVAGGGGGIYSSTNGGQSFGEVGNLSTVASSIFDIHFFDKKTGVIIKSGRIYKTTDAGYTWTEQYAEGEWCSIIEFTSLTIGYLAGGTTWDGNSVGEIHKTTDGGNSWSQIQIGPYEVNAICFINDTIGFYSTVDEELFKTLDGGISWSKVSDTVNSYFTGMVFVDEKEGYAVTYQGEVLKTTNGGVTWISVYNVSPTPLSRIIKTPNNIYVIGNDGIILKKDL